MNVLELKNNISPEELAQRLIGKPEKIAGKTLWYKSPFRKETQPSFVVSPRGFHDFGDNWSGDIVDFTKRIYNISFKEAIEFLKKEYGFTENEYENQKIKQIIKKQMIKRQEKEEKAIEWFNRIYGFLCDEWKMWNRILENIEPLSYEYAYVINQICVIDYWIDGFMEYSDKKEKLYEKRDEIEWITKYQTNSITS